jgi:hypothetical protein
MADPTRNSVRKGPLLLLSALVLLALACAMQRTPLMSQHRWWSGLGVVLPHDSFPADCNMCHVGNGWNDLAEEFDFDHELETGVPLMGAHSQAQCLRCHNDRGPVNSFATLGCAGCHEDVHLGQLGQNCQDCHQEQTWVAIGMIEKHYQTRFPLTGVHVATACWRCHPGAEVGNFVPTDPECVTCHVDDLNRTTNHVGLGRTDNCDRCHIPTAWEQAEVNN